MKFRLKISDTLRRNEETGKKAYTGGFVDVMRTVYIKGENEFSIDTGVKKVEVTREIDRSKEKLMRDLKIEAVELLKVEGYYDYQTRKALKTHFLEESENNFYKESIKKIKTNNSTSADKTIAKEGAMVAAAFMDAYRNSKVEKNAVRFVGVEFIFDKNGEEVVEKIEFPTVKMIGYSESANGEYEEVDDSELKESESKILTTTIFRILKEAE